MLITFLFKLGMAPLHQWGPDLYDSLPTHLTLWMVTIPKTAVLFLLSQNTIFIYDQSGLTYQIMAIFGIISLIIGSIGLGNQWKIKRF
jgi:NADH:ubiquinone oxidoreductase subunit 2 (subunit N)